MKQHVGELQENLTYVESKVRIGVAREETGGACRIGPWGGLVSHTKEFGLYHVDVRVMEGF